MAVEQLFWIWRRLRHDPHDWRCAPGLGDLTLDEALNAIGALKRVTGEIAWEYAIFPADLSPVAARARQSGGLFYSDYHTKVKRPR